MGQGIKNTHPLKIRGGIQSIPRFHPGYGQCPSLIDTVTGAPGRAFLLCGSEVVSQKQGNRNLSPGGFLSENLTFGHVFVLAFNESMIAQFAFLVKRDPRNGGEARWSEIHAIAVLFRTWGRGEEEKCSF